ncbi:asparaginase [Lentzea sp. NPDC058436]|uniref:asparaginase n=1 Tax=Lentzea sp. NPDC058436 TaxID=3346499 RepID=UPI00364991A4
MPDAPRHEPLAHVLRAGLVESVHHGSMIVLDPAGEVLFAAGEPDAVHHPRSTLKPVQAIAMVRLGLTLPADLLALAAGSHSGEERHVEGARELLSLHDLSPEDLRNPPELPMDPEVRRAHLAAGRGREKLAHNCSGKHAAMVATARLRGWSTVDYERAEHPVQQAIAATVAELSGETPAHVAVDGCGAPAFALTLRGLARAIGVIAAGREGTAAAAVAAAMRAHPEMVGGTGRGVTALLRAVPGVVTKDGAEGVQVAALANGCAVAVKVGDGAARPQTQLIAAGLLLCGVASEHLAVLLDGALGDRPDGVRLTAPLRGAVEQAGELRTVPAGAMLQPVRSGGVG